VYKNTQHTVITEQQIKMLVAKSFWQWNSMRKL
jgi:hypothetical protein